MCEGVWDEELGNCGSSLLGWIYSSGPVRHGEIARRSRNAVRRDDRLEPIAICRVAGAALENEAPPRGVCDYHRSIPRRNSTKEDGINGRSEARSPAKPRGDCGAYPFRHDPRNHRPGHQRGQETQAHIRSGKHRNGGVCFLAIVAGFVFWSYMALSRRLPHCSQPELLPS